MKTVACIAGLVAGLTTIAPSAHADIKNVGGLVCMHYSSSEAPKSSEYVTSSGRLCNDSGTERLRVICPLTQDAGNLEDVTATFDYVNWNPNGINGNEQSHPEDEFLCTVFTRTRYAEAYFWGTWKTAATPFTNGWGDAPTAMQATAAENDPGFIHGVCYIPRKYNGARSCVSHIRYIEEQ